MFAGDRPDSVLSSNFFDSQFSQVGLKVKSMCDISSRSPAPQLTTPYQKDGFKAPSFKTAFLDSEDLD